MVLYRWLEQETDIFNYCSCISRPPSRYEGEVLPEAVANIEIIENSQTEVANGEGNLCKNGDRLMTVSAIEIKLPTFRTSITILPGIT